MLPLRATISGTRGVVGQASGGIRFGAAFSAQHGISGYFNAAIPINPDIQSGFVSPAIGVIDVGIPLRTRIFASVPRLEQYNVVRSVAQPARWHS